MYIKMNNLEWNLQIYKKESVNVKNSEFKKKNKNKKTKTKKNLIKMCLDQCYQTRDLGARLGYFWFRAATFKALPLLRYFCATFDLLAAECLRNWAPLWKIVNFLSIQRDFELFQRQWAD